MRGGKKKKKKRKEEIQKNKGERDDVTFLLWIQVERKDGEEEKKVKKKVKAIMIRRRVSRSPTKPVCLK